MPDDLDSVKFLLSIDRIPQQISIQMLNIVHGLSGGDGGKVGLDFCLNMLMRAER